MPARVSKRSADPPGVKKMGEGAQPRFVSSPGSRPSTHSDDGVDLTLIRWMLSLTPAERLQVLQNNVGAIIRLRRDNTKLPLAAPGTSEKPH